MPIAEFSSGLRVVYKPRDLAVDVHFQELLSWLNERGDHPPFRTLKILNRGTHGWAEFVAEQACTSPDEVRRFYRRQGGYLAPLYALDATDFHYENLVAAGEHPVLVDLERSSIRAKCSGESIRAGGSPTKPWPSRSCASACCPRFWATDQSEGVDLSGLGADEGQLTPQPVPFWENAGTDAMQLTRKRTTIAGGRHRPSLDGAPACALDHIGDIEAGFTELYRLLRDHRDHLLRPRGFSGGSRGMRSGHPPLHAGLRDDARRELPPGPAPRRPGPGPVLRPTLGRGDEAPRPDHSVPGRTRRSPQGRYPGNEGPSGFAALWNCDGTRIAYEFPEPAMATVERRLPQMGDAGLDRQLWVIRASLATLSRSEGRGIRLRPRSIRSQTEGGDGFLAIARAIGDHLESVALRDEKEAAWLGLVAPPAVVTGRSCPWGWTSTTDTRACCSSWPIWARYGRRPLHDPGGVALDVAPPDDRSRPVHVQDDRLYQRMGGIIYTYVHLHALWSAPICSRRRTRSSSNSRRSSTTTITSTSSRVRPDASAA